MHKLKALIILGLAPTAFAGDGSFSGVSYSFTQPHPDFGVAPCGLSFGNVTGLDSSRPAYSGAGHEIDREWNRIVGGTGIMPLAPNLFGTADEACGAVVEDAGEAGPGDAGSVMSAATFAQWFRPTLGINQTWTFTLEDQDTAEGQWAMSDPDFRPAGVQGNLYTVALSADFVYESCAGQDFELSFRGDAWAFIGSTLVVDLGGTNHNGAWQWVNLDELSLNDGETYRLRIFLAHRTNGVPAALTIKTKDMTFAPVTMAINGSFD